MSFIEDTGPFFGDFGVQATLNGQAVSVIFDAGYAESFGGMVGGSGPKAIAQASINAVRDQSLVIASKTYTVVGVEPDGTGLVLLRLEEA